jgi:putative membrane protein
MDDSSPKPEGETAPVEEREEPRAEKKPRDEKPPRDEKRADEKRAEEKRAEEKRPEKKPEKEPPPPSAVVRRRRPNRFQRMLRQILFEEEEEAAFDEALIRTYLANERTFLAWLRTSVVLLGVGLGAIALGRVGELPGVVSLALGGLSTLTAVIMVIWAYISFGSTTAGIEQRRYRPARSFVGVAALLVIATGGVVLVLLAAEVLD